jgi:hypothetical protein
LFIVIIIITGVQGLRQLVREKRYYKPFLILNTLFLLMIFSGKFAIEFYAVRQSSVAS